MAVRVYRTTRGTVLQQQGQHFELSNADWNGIFRQPDPAAWLLAETARSPLPADAVRGAPAACVETPPGPACPVPGGLLPPIVGQEVWAAGVTYYRSRSARMEEASDAGGGDFYDRVYSAERPELFFKASAHRVVGHGGEVRVRGDARWNVPEPELTVCVSSAGAIFGYTVGNDMSSRDIEGENPLYLPQAKVYDGCCALGPGILLGGEPLPESTEIAMVIRRGGTAVFGGATRLEQMKRRPSELVQYLFRENSFPAGCFLMTGTGVVPPGDFTLRSGDQVDITIEPIGTLQNTVM